MWNKSKNKPKYVEDKIARRAAFFAKYLGMTKFGRNRVVKIYYSKKNEKVRELILRFWLQNVLRNYYEKGKVRKNEVMYLSRFFYFEKVKKNVPGLFYSDKVKMKQINEDMKKVVGPLFSLFKIAIRLKDGKERKVVEDLYLDVLIWNGLEGEVRSIKRYLG